MINLPYTFGEKVRESIDNYRIKNKIPTPKEIEKLYNPKQQFLETELDLVEELYITRDCLNYLDLFKNIKVLNITCAYQFSKEQIQEIIDKYKDLEELNIANQNQVTCISLEKQPNLQSLTIRSNKNLSRIHGLNELSNLFEISIYDNPELLEIYIKLICAKVSREALLGKVCKLDLLHIKELLEVMPKSISLEQLKLLDIKFVEQLKENSKIERLEHSPTQTIYVYEKAKEIVDKYIKETDTEKQKYAIINEWLCRNVTYDYEGMRKHTSTSNGQQVGVKGGTNSCVNAILSKRCVCQGYTKAAQLLLKIAGINSYDVSCMASEDEQVLRTFTIGEEKTSNSNHSLIRVSLDNEEYYSDITWDAGRIQKGKTREYFLLSKEDISVNHKLIDEEDIETSNTISLVEEDSLLEYARNRIEEVDKKKITR